MSPEEALTTLVRVTRQMKLSYQTHATVEHCSNVIMKYMKKQFETPIVDTESVVVGLDQE